MLASLLNSSQKMPESFIYFLWQYHYFDHTNLTTTDGEPIQVLHPGFRNPNAGPDFINARLLINDVEWHGTVEAHTKASDWLAHRHQNDRAYDNVILHIVWEADKVIARANGSPLPTLELQHRTDHTLQQRYALLTNDPGAIPCKEHWPSIRPLTITAMLDNALLQRLQRKASAVQTIYAEADSNWEETAYRLLSNNMGFKINAEPMSQLSRNVPLKALLKHRDTVFQLEAMLFGAAGLLEDLTQADAYTESLRREYRFLAAKYGFAKQQLPTHIWKWARLRPANFPTLRIAQLARLVSVGRSLFSLLTDTDEANSLVKTLQITPSDYWKNHYRFGKETAKGAPTLGQASAENIVINTAVPLLAAYAHHKEQPEYMDRALSLLEQLPAEHNHIADKWEDIGLSIQSAFDSQGSLELYNEFCQAKRCLNCQIGASIIGQNT